jgi:anti-sigma factor RsiW
MNHPEGHILQAYFDGELEAVQADEVQLHCASCDRCRAELTELEKVGAMLASDPDPDLTRPIWNAVRPDRTTEKVFRPALGLAACAAGITIGLIVGTMGQSTTSEVADSSWTESMTIWNGQATSSLLAVYDNSGE